MSGSTKDVLHALINHQVALALIEALAFRPDLKVEAFGQDELTLIVHPGHRWANERVLRAAELVQEPILLREIGSGMRHFVEEYLEQNGVLRQQLRTSIDMTSTEAIISAVEAGLGAGSVPSVAVEKAVQLRAVRSIPLDNGPIKRELSSALLNGPELRGPAGQLLELLHQNDPAIPAIQEPATNTPVAVRMEEHRGK